jgi:O-antigen ligase
VRPLALRVGAAGAAPLLGLGVYLTFSRGALSALAVGLLVLLALTPTWTQLRAAAVAAEAAVVAVAAWEALPADVVVVPLLALMLLAAAAQAWSAQAEEQETTRVGPLPLPRRARTLAWAAAALAALAPFAAYALEADEPSRDPAFGATAERLASAGSNRFGYWEVAVETWADDPAIGAGAGAFATEWIERRESRETVRDAHSLELETLAELGLVGLALLLAALAAVGVAATRAARDDPGFAAGPVAALAVWLAHSAIDWDWELPALTLVAAVLAGVLLGRAPARDPHTPSTGP